MVRFGMIGLGSISHEFARVFSKVDGMKVVAAASREMERSKAFCEEFGIPKAYDSYRALAEDPEIDAVYIGLTHNLHYEAAKLCVEHGKAVLCEKPFFLTEKEAKELTQLAKEKKVLMMEGFWIRFLPAFRKAREWVRSGRIGTPVTIKADFCIDVPFDPAHRLYNPEVAGGALLDTGVYPVQFASGILGENPSGGEGCARIGTTGVDEFASLSLSFPSGAVASLSCGINCALPGDAFVYGSEGSITVYGFMGSKKCELFDKKHNSVEVFTSDFEEGLAFEVEAFLQLLEEGKLESDVIPYADNIATAKLFEKLRKSWGTAR